MKNTAKIFIYIGVALRILFFAIIESFLLIGLLNVSYYSEYVIFEITVFAVMMLLALIIPIASLLVAHFTLKSLKVATKKDDIIGISVVCLIFSSIIGGIVLLSSDDKDFVASTISSDDKDFVASTNAKTSKSQEDSELTPLEKNLKRIRNMKESGVISQEEYDKLRKKLLENEYK